ncbi:MAG: hypothetical protein PHR79_02020 [Bacteroidales bacterium]|nr:hypothetical protein [Bacteroidales bacterium]
MFKKQINKALLVLGFAFLMNSTPVLAQENVGIGTATPNASALLDLTANNKGLLLPRVTLVAANNGTSPVNAPATGLLVYNTGGALPAGFYYWNSTQWTQVGSGGSASTCSTLQEAYDCGGTAAGRQIIVSGTNSVAIKANTLSSTALRVTQENSGAAIIAENTSLSSQYAAIQATSVSNYGIVGGTPPPTSAILGSSSGKAYAISGQIELSATAEAALLGNNLRTSGGHGVKGAGVNGVVGESNYAAGYGVYGRNTQNYEPSIGVYGIGVTGVAGQSSNTALSYGLYSYDDAGIFNSLDVGGSFSANGTKAFIIDHPADPENKFLKHFCIESNEVLNMYRGTVSLNDLGEAIVTLPAYFNDININFSYQLTAVGASMPNLYVKSEIGSDNSFVLSGGVANAKVSWTVYTERNDKLMQNNPEMKNSEPVKEGKYKGKYCSPEYYGKPKTASYLFRPEALLNK